MGKTKLACLGFCFLVLFLSAGCVTLPQDGSSSDAEKNKMTLSVAPILKFDDIPVPAGFKLLAQESFAFQNDRNRVALLKYAGGKPADAVVAFYKDQMASFNWDVINIIEYEKRILNYENSYESCIVTVESKIGKSIITIAVSPKSRPMKSQKETGEK